MLLYSCWEQTYHFENGWYIYNDGKGNSSVISYEQARRGELDYVVYQASMDVNRGGADPKYAYARRGLIVEPVGKYGSKYSLPNYRADAVPASQRMELKGRVVIPEKIGSFTINSVAKGAFMDCGELTEIVLPATVTVIGKGAFRNCGKLSKITIPYAAIDIKEGAFEGTMVQGAGEPEGAETVINKTLLHVNKSVQGLYRVPDGIEIIAEKAFEGCASITGIVVPESVQEIGLCAFAGCVSLEHVELPKHVRKLGAGAFSNCVKLTEVIIPEGVEELRSTFSGCESLQNVKLPKSVKHIWDDAFKKSGIMNSFMNSMKELLIIDNWLIHYKVPAYGVVTIPEGVTGIADQDSFARSQWQKPLGDYKQVGMISLPSSLRWIGNAAFYGTGIRSIEIPVNVQTIGCQAFRGSLLQKVVIPASVQMVEQWNFMDCDNLEELVFLGNTAIENHAITSRRDKATIVIKGQKGSHAHEYVKRWGEQHRLVFRKLG